MIEIMPSPVTGRALLYHPIGYFPQKGNGKFGQYSDKKIGIDLATWTVVWYNMEYIQYIVCAKKEKEIYL